MKASGYQRQQSKFISLQTGDESQQLFGVKDRSLGNKPRTQTQDNKLPKIIAIFAVVLICIFIWLNYNGSSVAKKQHPTYFARNATSFKKIFWIYTEALLDAELMNQIVFLHHHDHSFYQQGYQVRFVNSWNAYDYISDNETINKISKTMQNSQLDEGVHNLLKLALLYEHGGVLINSPHTVIADDNLTWVQDIFNTSLSEEQSKQQKPKVFLYKLDNKKLSDHFIAAEPKSIFFKHAFEALATLIRTGTHIYAKQTQILKKNEDRGIDYLPGGLSSILNLAVFDKSQTQKIEISKAQAFYGIQLQRFKNYILFNEIKQQFQLRIFRKPSYINFMKSINQQGTNLLFNVNQPVITELIQRQVMHLNIQDPKPLPDNSLLKKVLSAPRNKEVFIDPLPNRDIQMCLIIMKELTKEQIKFTRNIFQKQTYQNWKLVIPSLDPLVEELQVKHAKIFNGKFNTVHNIEKASTKHCDPKGFAILLNYGEFFNSEQALSQIAKAVTFRDTVAAYITLQHDGKQIAQQNLPEFNRNQEIVSPNITKLEVIINHLRVFSIEHFRYIPQMDLRDIYGKYFNDRLVFLMDFLELIRVPIRQPFQFYLAKKYANTMNIPARVAYVNQSILLRVKNLQQADRQQLKRLRTRLQCQFISGSMKQIKPIKIPFSKMLAFNPGNDFVSVDDKKGPQLIPKIIHQVWLGSKLPPAKEYFYRKTQKMYPSYEVKLWREENITQENFPLTYDVLQTILKFNKKSPYNKLASVTDILRHQVLYHEGGFWKDAGMNFLRPIFDKFLKYKLALAADKTFRYRWEQGMCFFSNMPRYENLWRITNFRNINRMRIYDNYAMAVAGPNDFSQLLVGQQQYDQDILLIPYQTFYPGQLVQHPQGDLCTRTSADLNGAKFQIEQNGWYVLSNCSDIYPYAYAIEHNRFGGTWNKRENMPK